MTSYGLFCAFVLIVQTCTVYGQEEVIKKGSLTFVIDDTASMSDEIGQIKDEVDTIFDTVLSSKVSQIENFILVTFNDPTAEVRTVTKDRNEFKRALEDIQVHGGGDCPEFAMKGIELGLNESLPFSYLYVFTDASAKDYNRFEDIKNLLYNKMSQVTFVMTGTCGGLDSADYQVYHKVAEATRGQVFNMVKDDVKDVLKYIDETVTGRRITLYNKKLSPGYEKNVTFHVDDDAEDALIAVTGGKPEIGAVIGLDGSMPTIEHLVSGKNQFAIVKVKNMKPGDYEVEVKSTSDTYVVITAKVGSTVMPTEPTSEKK